MNIPEVKSSCKYVTELCECLEDSLKLAQEEIEKSQKRYKRHYDKKEDQILLPTDNMLLMRWRGPYTVKSRGGANDYTVKMGSKTKTCHVNMLRDGRSTRSSEISPESRDPEHQVSQKFT